MSDWPTKELFAYVMTDDPAEIAQHHKKLGITQDQAVDDMIEKSCWGEDVPDFVGGKGTPEERRTALRAPLHAQIEKDSWVFDKNLLTPLEYEMMQVMNHIVAYIDDSREDGREALRIVEEISETAHRKGMRRKTPEELQS